jgi:hypothetical protein
MGNQKAICASEQACGAESADQGLVDFHVGTFPTKGCFAKNGKAYFSPGTEAEMATHHLAGTQVRVYCGGVAVFGQASNVEALEFLRIEDTSAGSTAAATKVGVAAVALGVASALF